MHGISPAQYLIVCALFSYVWQLKSVPLGVLSNKHYSMLAAKETQFLRKESLLHSQSACTADGADGDDGTSDHNHSIDSASQRQTRTLREDGRADGCHVSDTGDDDRTAGQDDYWTNHSQRSGSRNSDGNSNEAGSSSSVESDLGDDDDEEDDSRGGGARIVVKFTAKGMVKCSPAKRSKAVVSTSSSSASRYGCARIT